VPARSVFAIEGRGAPEGAVFQAAVAALHRVAFRVKSARKRAGAAVFKIGPLEARWWTTDPGQPLAPLLRTEWRWCLRLPAPPDVTEDEVAAAVAAATSKRGGRQKDSDTARGVKVDRLPPARCGRVLHLGPYAAESASLAKIHAAIAKTGFVAGSGHSEVYLSDPRRTPPAKLETVLLIEV